MIKNLDVLAKFVKGGADVLQKAISSEEEVSLELIDGRFVTDSELETMKTTVRNEGKQEGQTIGYDFAMKDLKKDFNLEIEGKDRKVIADAIKNNILAEANKKPDAKIQELTTSLENLRKTYSDEKSVWEQTESSYKGKLKEISVMSELQKNIPEVRGLNKNQFMTLVRSEYDFDFDDNGVLIAKKNGQTIKDTLEKVIPVTSILTDYATQNGWFGSDGRGGVNKTGSTKQFETINDVYRYMEKNNIMPDTPDGIKLLNEFKGD
jgi:hypothetical protein